MIMCARLLTVTHYSQMPQKERENRVAFREKRQSGREDVKKSHCIHLKRCLIERFWMGPVKSDIGNILPYKL